MARTVDARRRAGAGPLVGVALVPARGGLRHPGQPLAPRAAPQLRAQRQLRHRREVRRGARRRQLRDVAARIPRVGVRLIEDGQTLLAALY